MKLVVQHVCLLFMAYIYKIYNNTNDHIYIGSTINFSNRRSSHIEDCKSGKHHNHRLQKDYDLGYQFNMIVLEEFQDTETRYIREQYYINELMPYYNILKIADPSCYQDDNSDKYNYTWYKPIDKQRYKKRSQLSEYWSSDGYSKIRLSNIGMNKNKKKRKATKSYYI